MTPKLKRVYKQAKANKSYCASIKDAVGCWVPHGLSCDAVKIAFAAMYQGYQLKVLGATSYTKWWDSL